MKGLAVLTLSGALLSLGTSVLSVAIPTPDRKDVTILQGRGDLVIRAANELAPRSKFVVSAEPPHWKEDSDVPIFTDEDDKIVVIDGGDDSDETGPPTPTLPALEARQASRTTRDTTLTPTAFTSREGKFSRDMLGIHNRVRALHDAPPVRWNKTMATFAARNARKCNFKHSGGPYGENLSGGGPMNNPVWYFWYLYTEVNNYDYDKPGFHKDTGHFTQMVWKESREIGCAFVAGCPNLSYQVWCEYWPRGNVAPEIHYRNNVTPRRAGTAFPAAPPQYDDWYN